MGRATFAATHAAVKMIPPPPMNAVVTAWQEYHAARTATLTEVGWTEAEYWREYANSGLLFDDMTADWINNPCTSEISTTFEKLEALKPRLDVLNVQLAPHGARWMARVCDTCTQIDSDTPVHLSIEQYRWAPYGEGTLFDTPPLTAVA